MAFLAANATDATVSMRALRQIHRLTTNYLYRRALGDALSDAINTYIYRNYQSTSLVERFIDHVGIEILFYDYVEAACKKSAARMIKQITIGQWKKQSAATIQLAIRHVSNKIRLEGTDLIEPRALSAFSEELKKLLASIHSADDRHEGKQQDLNLLTNVLTKIHFVFGSQPFIERSRRDPFFLYANQLWFPRIVNEEKQRDIAFLVNGWKSMLIEWLKLDNHKRRSYFEQIDPNLLYNDDDD